MYRFLIKKFFFDLWDNILTIFALNFGFIIFGAAAALLGMAPNLFLTDMPEINLRIFGLILISVLFVYLGAVSGMTRDIADYKQPKFKDFLRYLKETWHLSLILAVINFTLFSLFDFVLTFYMGNELFFTPFALAFVFWAGLTWLGAGQFIYAMYNKMEKNLFKLLKKIFIFFFDNPLYSVTVLLLSIILLGVSIPTLLMIPGFAGIQLLFSISLKLRVYKYDYLEKSENKDAKKIPWDELLEDDKKLVGKRTFKNTLFPWKK